MTKEYQLHTILLCFAVLISFLYVQPVLSSTPNKADSIQSVWVDSVLTSLSLEEKIAQLMMIRTYSNKDVAYYTKVEETIREV